MPILGIAYAYEEDSHAILAVHAEVLFRRPAIDRARKVLGAGTDAETVRLAVERVVELEKFWRFMAGTRGKLDSDGKIRPTQGF